MLQTLEVNLQPKQIQFFEAIEKKPVTFFGGAKGGGKSYALRNLLLARRFQYAGSHGAIFRKTYAELDANHIRPLLGQHPVLRQFWAAGKKLLELPNGSTLQFCHCSNEADIDLYQGREFHDLAIDEAGQWTEAMVRKLMGSNRSSVSGIPARTILTGNPGGPGHKWLKRLFVEKRYNEREKPDDYAFIQALVDDNPALVDNDPEYVARLESEPNETLRKAFRYGSWDIFAGQFFSEISREAHLIDPFAIPKHWNRFGAYDYGFNHPAAFGWFAVDEDGTVYQYRELIQARLRIDEFCTLINRFPDTEDLTYIAAGWDCWAKKGTLQSGSTPTIAEEFLKHKIILSRAKIDRVQGASQVRTYLASIQGASPRFKIFKTCPVSFDTLTRMEHDPDHVEDVLKVDAVDGDPLSGDDAYDMIRYGLMSRPMLTDPPKFKGKPGTPAWIEFQAKQLHQSIDKQIERDEKIEQGIDAFNTSGMEEDDIMNYYINKRKR
jgi:phage terminase large subunit